MVIPAAKLGIKNAIFYYGKANLITRIDNFNRFLKFVSKLVLGGFIRALSGAKNMQG